MKNCILLKLFILLITVTISPEVAAQKSKKSFHQFVFNPVRLGLNYYIVKEPAFENSKVKTPILFNSDFERLQNWYLGTGITYYNGLSHFGGSFDLLFVNKGFNEYHNINSTNEEAFSYSVNSISPSLLLKYRTGDFLQSNHFVFTVGYRNNTAVKYKKSKIEGSDINTINNSLSDLNKKNTSTAVFGLGWENVPGREDSRGYSKDDLSLDYKMKKYQVSDKNTYFSLLLLYNHELNSFLKEYSNSTFGYLSIQLSLRGQIFYGMKR